MTGTGVKIEVDTSYHLRLGEEILNDFVHNLNRKRDDQIIEKLKEKGYKFKTSIGLWTFLNERCMIKTMPNKLCGFFVDDKLVFEYWDTFRTERQGSMLTGYIGEPALEDK